MNDLKVAKLDIKDLLPIGITLVVVGIGLAFGLQITGETRDDIGLDTCAARSDNRTIYDTTTQLCTDGQTFTASPQTAEFNASKDAITGISKLPAKLPTIALVLVAAIIIGVLIRNLFMK